MTELNRWFDLNGVYTRDSWEIPEDGTDIWCTGWPRGQTIKPYGDGCHVVVGLNVYHCAQLMDIMTRWEQDGYAWGVEGVKVRREQWINGRWMPVEV